MLLCCKTTLFNLNLNRPVTKPTKWPLHPAKTQISLGIRPVWSESSLCTLWVAKDLTILHAKFIPGWSESSLGAQSFCWFCRAAAHFRLITATFSGVQFFLFFFYGTYWCFSDLVLPFSLGGGEMLVAVQLVFHVLFPEMTQNMNLKIRLPKGSNLSSVSTHYNSAFQVKEMPWYPKITYMWMPMGQNNIPVNKILQEQDKPIYFWENIWAMSRENLSSGVSTR